MTERVVPFPSDGGRDGGGEEPIQEQAVVCIAVELLQKKFEADEKEYRAQETKHAVIDDDHGRFDHPGIKVSARLCGEK